MGIQKRNPWNVLLFFLVVVTVAYLCKRGWDGFYNTPGVWVSTQFIQLIHGHHWWTWDVPIPTADGIYSCVADAGDGRKIMWTCTVSGGEYTVSGLSKQGNVCEVRLHFSATITPRASPSTTSAYTFPTYPSRHRPAYFGIDFWYCSPAGANYVLTVTQIDPPPVAPAVAAPATPGYTPANVPLNYLKYLFQQAGCDPRNLTEADLTVKYWRGLPSIDSIINDMRAYAVAYSTGSGSQTQKDFCQPPSTAQAGYMPSQTVNPNRVRKTKTCSTCPSAPLLSSLPTPSIEHNVNLPHYCQRLVDDEVSIDSR